MKLIFPNPKLSWCQADGNWFLQLPEDIKNRVGEVVGNEIEGYCWYAYSYLEKSGNEIAWGQTKSIAEAKKKVKEALIAAGAILNTMDY
jgi:hypothetical protein